MDAIEKEVERVAARIPTLYPQPLGQGSSAASTSSSPSKSKRPRPTPKTKSTSSSANVAESLDSLLESLESIRSSLSPEDAAPTDDAPSAAVVAAEVKSLVTSSQKAISDRHKEVYNALSRLGKAYDKKFTTPVDGIADPALFMGQDAQKALEAVVLDHMLRMGEWDAAEQLSKDSSLPVPPSDTYRQLDAISHALDAGHLQPAMQWAEANREFLSHRGSSLEFALHRSQFIRIATAQQFTPVMPGSGAPIDPDGDDIITGTDEAGGLRSSLPKSHIEQAVHYGRQNFRPHLRAHLGEIQSLYSFILFLPQTLPADPDAGSPSSHLAFLRELVPYAYHHFLEPTLVHSPYLLPMFQVEFCARNRLAREAPLKTAVEVGAGGALMKIMKVRQVMKMRGNEWSQANELPTDIPLPPHLRFHSTFTCPVSKEQATEENPPMMMACGHVVCAESLARLGSRTHGKLKCVYCPTESTVGQAVRLYL